MFSAHCLVHTDVQRRSVQSAKGAVLWNRFGRLVHLNFHEEKTLQKYEVLNATAQRNLFHMAERTHVPRRADAIFLSSDVSSLRNRTRVMKLLVGQQI